ncbi:MAG: hypothetical protein Fur0017_12740 [Anaerolineales bacterium]
MKATFRSILVLAAVFSMLVSACAGAASTTSSSVGGDKPHATLVEFTGVIEAIEGNQWTINGQVITVEPTMLKDGPFQVGDTVKVEVEVQGDGSVVTTRVERPVAGVGDNSNGNDSNFNDNTNSSLANSNDNTNTSVVNSNDNDNTNSSPSIGGKSSSNSNSNSNDDNGNDDDDNSNDGDDNGGNDGNGNGGDDGDDDNQNGADDDNHNGGDND